jgi:hypothetical protein
MAVKKKIASGLIISNASTVARGFMLKKGMLVIQPGEVKPIPVEVEAEVQALMKTPAVQMLFDKGLLRTDGLTPGTQLKSLETPKPPANLSTVVPVPGSGLIVGANGSPAYNPNSGTPITGAGSVTV